MKRLGVAAMLVGALVAFAFVAGDRPIDVGSEVILYDSDPTARRVIWYCGDPGERSFEAVPIGTKAVYLGDAPPRPELKSKLARVRLAEGEWAGQVGSVIATYLRRPAR